MFANLKTKGFALETTHPTDSEKPCTLLALIAFAVALTVKTGVAMARLHPIPVKKHGRRAWSLFALGLYTLRKIFLAAVPLNSSLPRPIAFPKTTFQIPSFFGFPIGSRVLCLSMLISTISPADLAAPARRF
jgi:hypothetical protein